MTLYSSAMPTKKKSDAKNATRGAEDLGKVLGVLDKLWKERVPSLLLRPGNAGGASALAKALGAELPPELELWFSWHDGQTESTPLSDESTFFLHSSASAADAYAFLRSEAEAYDPAWVPLFENGGGDHRVYDRTTGAIVSYWHDDAERPVAFESLVAWAKATAAALDKLAPPRRETFCVNDLAWKKVTRAPADVATCAPGTMFQYPMKLAMGDRHEVTIKLAPDKWLHGNGLNFEGALAQLAKHLEVPPAKNSGYWKSDGSTAYDLQMYSRGLRQAQAS
jgi:cell wall assembly regulator SMI1